MMKGKWIHSVKLISSGNIICGSRDGYYLVDITNKKERKLLSGDKQDVISICLLSEIDTKYNDLALTLERGNSVNILNMVTGSITKIADVPITYF